MSETLNEIWNRMVAVGFNVRKNRMNGMEEWQPYKQKYSKYSLKDKNTIPLKREFIDFSNNLEYDYKDKKDHSDVLLKINNVILDNKIETNHFIIQHFRIPRMLNYNLDILKFAQLAYNVGQASAVFMYENVYSNDIKEFYYDNGLNKITTYLEGGWKDQPTQPSQIGSGTYYNKYLKYKKKYIQLKNSQINQ